MSIDSTDQDHHEASESPSEGGTDESTSTLVGDGYDPEPLLSAGEVADILGVPEKSVYELPIKRVRISRRRVRWRPEDVRNFIERRVETPA